MSRGPWKKKKATEPTPAPPPPPPKPEPPKLPTAIIIPNCTYHINGCASPGGCESCGFDKREAERRKQIPLTIGSGGLARKIVGRNCK